MNKCKIEEEVIYEEAVSICLCIFVLHYSLPDAKLSSLITPKGAVGIEEENRGKCRKRRTVKTTGPGKNAENSK